MDDSSNTVTQYSSALVSRMFHKRRKNFGRSLQQILIQVSHDEIVRNLMQDRASSQFVIGRVEEIIRSILTDDREHFIDVLLQKLQNFEALYSTEHTENIRVLSDRLLSVTDEQNQDEISNVRRIQTLIEQVNALQAEVVELRGRATGKSVDLDAFNDPNDRAYFDTKNHLHYHIFNNCDLTELDLQVKMIQTDAQSTKEMLTVLCTKMHQIFEIAKNKCIQRSKMYKTHIDNLQTEVDRSRAKVGELQNHFDQSVIPQLTEKHRESSEKHKKLLQQRLNEIEDLKRQLAVANAQVNSIKSEQQQLQNQINSLEQQHEEDENHYYQLQESNNADKRTIKQQADEILELQHQIELIKQNTEKVSRSFKQAQDEIQKMKQAGADKDLEIKRLQTEVKTLNDQNMREKEESKAAKVELEAAKEKSENLQQSINDITLKNKELEYQVNDLQPKYEEAKKEISDVKDKLREMMAKNENQTQQIQQQNKELDNIKYDLNKMKNDLTVSQAQSKKNEEQVLTLQNEKKNLQNDVDNLEEKIRTATNETERIRNQLNDEKLNTEKQKIKIESLEESNKKMKNENETITRQNARVEQELRQMRENLQTLEDDKRKVNEDKEIIQTKLDQTANEKDEIANQLKEASQKLQEAEKRSNENNLKINDQAKQVISLQNQVDDLQNQVNEFKEIKEKNEKALDRRDVNIKELENKIEELNEKHRSAAKKYQENEEDNVKLQTQNNELNAILKEVQKGLPESTSLKDIPHEIEKLRTISNAAENVLKALGIPPSQLSNTLAANEIGEFVANKLSNLKQQEEVYNQINALIPSDSPEQLVGSTQAIVNENNRLKSEIKRISALISAESNVDISKTIEEIIEKQNKLTADLNQAADFISTFLEIIIGRSSNPIRITFPLKKNIETKLIDLVTRIKHRADTDRDQIEHALEKAKSYGYDGESVIEAAEIIVAREGEVERQQTMSMIDRELGDVRNLGNTESQLYIKKNEELKKKIQNLRESLFQQTEKARNTEEELRDEIESLQTELRRLKSELSDERKLREELTLMSAGDPADTNLIRSKLTKKGDKKLFSYIEKMGNSERESSKNFENQKSLKFQFDNVTKSTSNVSRQLATMRTSVRSTSKSPSQPYSTSD